jgi:hypothetical protein
MSADQLRGANDAQGAHGGRSIEEYRDRLRELFGPGNFRVRKSGAILIKTVDHAGVVRWMPHGSIGDEITAGVLFDDDDDEGGGVAGQGATPLAPAVGPGQVAVSSEVLLGYECEGWEIAARVRGALAIIEANPRAEDDDDTTYARLLLRAAIARAERLALAVGDRRALPAGGA